MSQDQSLSADHHQARDARKAVLGVCVQTGCGDRFLRKYSATCAPAGPSHLSCAMARSSVTSQTLKLLAPPCSRTHPQRLTPDL